MRRAAICLTVLLLLGAGCLELAAEPSKSTGPASAWTRQPCDPSQSTGFSRNAPLIASLRMAPADVAATMAAALGDPLKSSEPSETSDDWTRWQTERGQLQENREVSLFDPSRSENRYYSYMSNRVWPSTEKTSAQEGVVRFLYDLGVPSHLVFEHRFAEATSREGLSGSSTQLWNGHRLQVPSLSLTTGENSGSPTGQWTSLSVSALVELPEEGPRIAAKEAWEKSRDYMRCILDLEGKTDAAGYGLVSGADPGPLSVKVANESLVFTISLYYTSPDPVAHCGFGRTALIDTMTGAVHGWQYPPCD